jgi:hypothetical protein
VKLHKCPICADLFTKSRPLQKVCGPACAQVHARFLADKKQARKDAAERATTREKLKALETYPQLVEKAQAAFNAFVRARDAGKLCISCNTRLPEGGVGGGFDCGHYRSRGSAPHMRFVEDNAHGQCKKCNRYMSGNAVEYRKGLIDRIGIVRVEQLERDQTLRKYTREGLEEIVKHYRTEARKLKNAS